MASRVNTLAQSQETRGRTRTARSSGGTNVSRKIKYVPPAPLQVEEEGADRRTATTSKQKESTTNERRSTKKQMETKQVSPRKTASSNEVKQRRPRRPRRDLDPAAIERAARKELQKKQAEVKPPESPRRKLKASVGANPNEGRKHHGSSRSRSPHKAYVLGNYNTDDDDAEDDDDDDDSGVDYEEDSFAGDDDDIMGITIDDDGDLEKYMDPEARANLRRRKDHDSEDSDDDSDESTEQETVKGRGSIFQRFRSTSPTRRRVNSASGATISSPAGKALALIAKSLSPGTRSAHKVRAKQTDGSSNPRRVMRRGSGTFHNDGQNESAGSQMARRLSGSFESIKLALDGLGSQHGARSSHQSTSRWRSRQVNNDEELENFDWDENRELTREEKEYFERMYNEIEQLDL